MMITSKNYSFIGLNEILTNPLLSCFFIEPDFIYKLKLN
jgi:hypothetical protein